MPEHFLVTGGAGFIGSHLVDALLAAGHRVRVLDDLSTGRRDNLDPRAELIVGSITDVPLVRSVMAGVTGCFHLAAIASVARCTEDWVGTSAVNIGGTIAVFDAARRAGRVPVVYASSAAVYGAQDRLPIAEDAPAAPLSSYGADKLAAELHAHAAWVVHGLPAMGFRFFNVYGPRQDPASPYSGVISIFTRRLLAGLPIEIHGDGGQTRDFIAVADIVRFLWAGLSALRRAPQSRVFNACTGHATSVRDLAATLARVTASASAIRSGPARSGDIRASVGDPGRAASVLGVVAETSLTAGLAALVAAERGDG